MPTGQLELHSGVLKRYAKSKTCFVCGIIRFRGFCCLVGLLVFNVYNVVLVSAIQQHESAVILHISPPS